MRYRVGANGRSRRESLKIYLLQGESYQENEKSRLFSDIDIKKILPYYVELGWTQGASVALRQFEALVESGYFWQDIRANT